MKLCLIVDDSEVTRAVAHGILRDLGVATEEAEDGIAALAACRAMLPDAILLDWRMPRMDGIAFLGELRRMPGGERPRVIVCSSLNELEHIKQAMAAGADEYIMKPFDAGILRAKFAQLGLV